MSGGDAPGGGVGPAAGGGAEAGTTGRTPAQVLDLRGVGCPLNYVKVRVALDRLAPGQTLEAWIDHGEAEENVPRSCEEDGFPVLAQEDLGDRVRIVVSLLAG